jgi:hypothetical protein
LTAPRTLVVVPALNERRSIFDVVASLRSSGFDTLVVDDGSTDGTGALARDAGAAVLTLPFNLGVGGALRCGFKWAVEHGYDVVVQCDADGQHRADQVALLLEAQRRTGADLVVGSRFAHDPDWDVGVARRVAMRVLCRVASRAAGTRITDSTSGFRCIAQPLLQEYTANYPTQYLGDTFEALVAAGRRGYRVVEVPAQLDQRRHGSSSAGRGASLRYLARAMIVTLLRIEIRLPPRLDEAADRGSGAVPASPGSSPRGRPVRTTSASTTRARATSEPTGTDRSPPART